MAIATVPAKVPIHAHAGHRLLALAVLDDVGEHVGSVQEPFSTQAGDKGSRSVCVFEWLKP